MVVNIYGCYRSSESKGMRQKQHYNFTGCKARIRMYKIQKDEQKGKVKTTNVDLEHNHPISKDLYESENIHYSTEERDLIGTLHAANAKPSQIKRVLLDRCKKKVTIQSLKNLFSKITPGETEDELHERLQNFLSDTEMNGGVIEWLNNEKDGKMKALFITSQSMKAAFRACDPPLVQLDVSFGFDQARYKVAAFCYLDQNSDRTEIAAFGIMSEESAPCFEFILNHFSRICVRQNIMFIIDKDFTELEVIRKVFPGVIIVLCMFHTLKYMKTLFSTIPDVVEVKHEVMNQFKKVLDSNTEEIFEEETAIFEDLIENVQVKTGDKYVSLKDYYIKNWKSCSLMWVKCYRKNLPLLGDNTTNRIENRFRNLKLSITDTFKSIPNTPTALIHLVTFADDHLKEKYLTGTKKALRIYSSNPQIRKLSEEASLLLNDAIITKRT